MIKEGSVTEEERVNIEIALQAIFDALNNTFWKVRDFILAFADAMTSQVDWKSLRELVVLLEPLAKYIQFRKRLKGNRAVGLTYLPVTLHTLDHAARLRAGLE
jgi:hypothetical protein